MHQIEGNLKLKLLRLAVRAAPNEAVGLILNDRSVVELTNLRTEGNFEVSRDEVRLALEGEANIDQVTLWHSHPNGGVGPSRADVQNKSPIPYHLVISLVNGEIIPTWY